MEYYGNCTRLPPGPAAHTFSDLTTQKYGEWGVLDGGSSNWITSFSCKKAPKTWKHHETSKEIQFVQAGWSWSYCGWVVVFKICDPKGFGVDFVGKLHVDLSGENNHQSSADFLASWGLVATIRFRNIVAYCGPFFKIALILVSSLWIYLMEFGSID